MKTKNGYLLTGACLAGALLVSGCTELVPQRAGEGEFDCQIICRFADGTVQGGESVGYDAFYDLDAAQFGCEAQVDENPALLQSSCPEGSTPSGCSCYESSDE